jgi:hypothetical protein
MQYGGDDLELYGGVVPLKEACGSQNPNQNYGDNNFILKHLKQVLILQDN